MWDENRKQLGKYGFGKHGDVLRDLVPFAQFKKRENTHGGALLLVKLQTKACNFTKSNTTSWMFFMFLKLYKWYQIAQNITYYLTMSWFNSNLLLLSNELVFWTFFDGNSCCGNTFAILSAVFRCLKEIVILNNLIIQNIYGWTYYA